MQSQQPPAIPSTPVVWRTASGYDVARIRFAVGESFVRAIAVLGKQEVPIIQVAAKAAKNAAENEDDHFTVLAMALAGGLNPSKVRWPRVEDGQLVTSRSRNKNTTGEIGEQGFGREFLELRPGAVEFHPTLSRKLDSYRSSTPLEPAYVADLANQAKWGVHPREYGEPTLAAATHIRNRLFELETHVFEHPAATLDAEVSKCQGNEDLDQLAAWWDLVRQGSRELSEGIAVVQRLALGEALNEPGGRDVGNEGEGVHGFLYVPQPEFAYSSFHWSLREGQARLRLPHLFAAAIGLLPRSSWWLQASKAVAEGDPTPFRDPQGDYVALLHAIADWRILGKPLPDDGWLEDGTDKLLSFMDGPLPEPEAPREPRELPGIHEAIREALADNPVLREVYTRIEIRGELGKDVAADLQRTPARISQILKQAKEKLGESSYLRGLFETLE